MKVKEYYFARRKLILNKGEPVRFWIDPWLDNIPLCESFPALFDNCQGQDRTFEKAINCEMSV
jgi:hypothetical protein